MAAYQGGRSEGPKQPTAQGSASEINAHSVLASSLSSEFEKHFENVRVQIQQDLRAELHEFHQGLISQYFCRNQPDVVTAQRPNACRVAPIPASCAHSPRDSPTGENGQGPEVVRSYHLTSKDSMGEPSTKRLLPDLQEPVLPDAPEPIDDGVTLALSCAAAPAEPRCPSPPPRIDSATGLQPTTSIRSDAMMNQSGASAADSSHPGPALSTTLHVDTGRVQDLATIDCGNRPVSKVDTEKGLSRVTASMSGGWSNTSSYRRVLQHGSTGESWSTKPITIAAHEAASDIDVALMDYMIENTVKAPRRSSMTIEECRFPLLARLDQAIPIFHPQGNFIRNWSISVYMAVIFVVTSAPFEVGFYWWDRPLSYKVFARILDVAFLLDMAVHFNTAHYEGGVLERDRKSIARHYLRSYFLLDCIANFPFELFLARGSGFSHKFRKLGKLPKVLRFIRLMGSFKDYLEYIGMTASVGCVALLAHYSTCLWAMSLAGDCEENRSCPHVGESYVQAFRISLAAFLSSETFSSHFGALAGDQAGLLVAASWRVVGEPLRPREDLLAIAVNFLGILAVAFVFANVISAFHLRSEVSQQRKKLLDRRKEEITMAALPHRLSQKVLASYHYLWRSGAHLFDIRDGLLRDVDIALSLRREIAHHVYGEALRQVPIFEDVPERFIQCLSQSVEVKHYTPGDYVVMLGEIGTELFMITEGRARPMNEHGEWIGCEVFAPGRVFGELCFLAPGTRRYCSVVCLSLTITLVLTLDTFNELGLEGALASVEQTAKAHIAVTCAVAQYKRVSLMPTEGDD